MPSRFRPRLQGLDPIRPPATRRGRIEKLARTLSIAGPSELFASSFILSTTPAAIAMTATIALGVRGRPLLDIMDGEDVEFDGGGHAFRYLLFEFLHTGLLFIVVVAH